MIPLENVGGLGEELNEDIQNIYAKCLKFWELSSVINLKYRSGMDLDNDIVNEKYINIFEEDNPLHFAKELRDVTGIGPDYKFDGMVDAVQKAYLRMFRIYGESKDLKEFTGVNPNYGYKGMKESIQSGYLFAFKMGADYLVKCLKSTGIKPDLKVDSMKEAVQEDYLRLFKLGFIERIQELKEVTGILPDTELLKKYPQYAKYFGDSQ